MPLDYEQYLSDELKNLYFDGRYSGLRELIKDKELVFAVRKNEIHIYYLGGRILKITEANGKLKLCFDPKYAKKKKGSDEFTEYGDIIKMLNDDPYNVDLWIENFDVLKRCMRNFRENVSHNAERQLQQSLELENRDFDGEVVVIDNEYGVREFYKKSSKLCKVDLVALFRDDGKYKICLIELKCGDGSIDGRAGIIEHIADFKTFLSARRADIIASVNNSIEYKKYNNYLYNVPGGIKLSEDTEICASILCYDLSETKKRRVSASIEESRESITFDLHYNLDLKSRCHKLSKKDILGE